MENHDWKKIKDAPGEYIAGVVLLHLNQAGNKIRDSLERLSTKPWPTNGCSWELIEPLLKEKWQDLIPEKRNETIRIFHHISEAIRESLTDWLDSLRMEIENLANGGEYSGTYLGSYGHKEGPWDLLSETEEPLNQVKGIIETVQMVFENKEDFNGVFYALETVYDLLGKIENQIDSAGDVVLGRIPKKISQTRNKAERKEGKN